MARPIPTRTVSSAITAARPTTVPATNSKTTTCERVRVDTTDLQALLTSFAGLAVRSAIAEAAALLGESAVQGALVLADLGDMTAQNEDFLDALDLYKAAAQALP